MILKSSADNEVVEIKVGFSWTVFIFGGFTLLARKMYWHGFILIGLDIVSLHVASFLYAFVANKASAKYYIRNGYEPTKDESWFEARRKWHIPETMNEQEFVEYMKAGSN